MADPRSPVDQTDGRALRSLGAGASAAGAPARLGRHAAWLLLSGALHAGIVMALLQLPGRELAGADKQVLVQPGPPLRAAEARRPALPPPHEEPPPGGALLEDGDPSLLPAPRAEQELTPIDVASETPDSPFAFTGWQASIGATPAQLVAFPARFAERPTGRGKLGGRPALATTAQAIELGLEWLRHHQDEDGRFDASGFMKHDVDGIPCTGPGSATHDVGITGLALLAFLGDGSTMRVGPYREQVRRAVHWLRAQQNEATGLIGSNAATDFVYDHAIAAYALCEAYGLSESSWLRSSAQKAIDYLAAHRGRYGTFGYQPRSERGDTSVTGWCLMAMKSAQEFRLHVDPEGLAGVEQWLAKVTDAQGRAGYTALDELSSRHDDQHARRFPRERTEALTAVGLLCRLFLGQDPNREPAIGRAVSTIMRRPPVWDPAGGSIDDYYWYHASYALFQIGGHFWEDWSKKLRDAVVLTQRRDGNNKGSWDPIGVWGQDGGRVCTTALLTLTMQAHYRYSRLLR